MSDLIVGGYLAQLIILTLVWGAIAILAVTHQPIPDPLLDAGFIILGFYFHSTLAATSRGITSDKIRNALGLGHKKNE